MQQRGNLLSGLVDCRGNDVGWCLASQLDNVLAKIRLHHLIAMLLQMRVEVNLLRGHRLALDDHPRAEALRQAGDNLTCLSRVVRPMHLHPDALGLRGEEFEVLIQTRHGSLLDRACLRTQFLGIPQGCHGCHATGHEVGDQELQGLLQRRILERLSGVFLKSLSAEMCGVAPGRCLTAYLCLHGPTLRAQMASVVRRLHHQRSGAQPGA